MPDQNNAADHKPVSDSATPAGLAQRQIPATDNESLEPADPEAESPQSNAGPTHATLLREIRWLDLINAGVAVAMLIVAIAAYHVASDTSDIKSAVRNISNLASETKREADALNSQFEQVKRQADALAAQVDQMKRQATATETMAKGTQGQLKEAQRQTRAISEQTSAIKGSSTAEIRSAQAQEQAAKADASAHKPALVLSGIDIDDLDSAPDKDALVHGSFRAQFKNIGGTTILNPVGTTSLLFATELPSDPNSAKFTIPIGGNDISILQGAEFSTSEKTQFVVPKTLAADAVAARIPALVFGTVNYTDTEGGQHRYCFAYLFPLKDGHPQSFFFQTGSPRYHCDT